MLTMDKHTYHEYKCIQMYTNSEVQKPLNKCPIEFDHCLLVCAGGFHKLQIVVKNCGKKIVGIINSSFISFEFSFNFFVINEHNLNLFQFCKKHILQLLPTLYLSSISLYLSFSSSKSLITSKSEREFWSLSLYLSPFNPPDFNSQVVYKKDHTNRIPNTLCRYPSTPDITSPQI